MTASTTKPPATAPPGNGNSLATRGSAVEVSKQRVVAEAIAAMEVARRFPRDQKAAIDRILQACARPSLAENALYEYARGGQDITGPSIRLAEAIAQNWGNVHFGVREVEQRLGESTAEAYAWDLETNTRSVKEFQVAHKRVTRERTYDLTDPRDIYETVANQGARRLRACILQIVPGDVVEMAVNQVEVTLRANIEITPKYLESMLQRFGAIGVTKEMIEARIQRRIDAMTPALALQLSKAYNSIKDGMGSVPDFFQAPEPAAAASSTADAIKDTLRGRQNEAAEPAEPEKVGDKPVVSEAAAAIEAERASAERKLQLRNAIAEVWKGIKQPARATIVARFYGKQTLLDLNEAQLEELLEKLPEIIEGAGA